MPAPASRARRALHPAGPRPIAGLRPWRRETPSLTAEEGLMAKVKSKTNTASCKGRRARQHCSRTRTANDEAALQGSHSCSRSSRTGSEPAPPRDQAGSYREPACARSRRQPRRSCVGDALAAAHRPGGAHSSAAKRVRHPQEQGRGRPHPLPDRGSPSRPARPKGGLTRMPCDPSALAHMFRANGTRPPHPALAPAPACLSHPG